MAHFFRISNNILSSIGEVKKIGFSKEDPFYIPDDYLQKSEFVIMRTCHGIGDWCIISAMPRLLKNKYPNCKVYVPSSHMLKNIFGNMLNTWGYGVYDSSKITNDIFINNPYVDKFIDEVDGEIYHDHYRIYDLENSKIPLVEQMLNFWQFSETERDDSGPDIYFSEQEVEEYNKILNNDKNRKYGYISVSSTYGSTTNNSNSLVEIIKQNFDNDMMWYYYGETPISETNFNFLKNVVELKSFNLSIRHQMYLKCNAVVNIGNETGMNLWSSKYSKTYILSHKYYGKIHGGANEGKIRKDPFSSGNFVKNIVYID
jgi:hypothetical protein